MAAHSSNAFREADLRDEVENIDRTRRMMVASYGSLITVSGAALFVAPPAVGAILAAVIIPPLVRDAGRFRALGSRTLKLLGALDSSGNAATGGGGEGDEPRDTRTEGEQ